MDVCRNGRRNQIDKYLKAGINANCENSRGETPLFCAALKGQVQCVEYLLLHSDADLNHCTKDDNTALHGAVMGFSEEVAKVLLDYGIQRTKNRYGMVRRMRLLTFRILWKWQKID